MSDELTPQEKKMFDELPRERMPAGLEERVVGSMREHGFLAKRRRTIELTTGRVAAVLAASVAIVIGAYSIGLQRGGVEEAYRKAVPETFTELGAPPRADDAGRVQAPASTAPAPAPVQSSEELQGTLRDEARSRTNASPEPAREIPAEDVASPPAPASDEDKKDLTWQLKKVETDAVRETEAPAAKAGLARSSDAPVPSMTMAEASKRPLTFVLGGKTVVIEAPDSVRVVEEEKGRTLLVYTSDGVIRIRLTD